MQTHFNRDVALLKRRKPNTREAPLRAPHWTRNLQTSASLFLLSRHVTTQVSKVYKVIYSLIAHLVSHTTELWYVRGCGVSQNAQTQRSLFCAEHCWFPRTSMKWTLGGGTILFLCWDTFTLIILEPFGWRFTIQLTHFVCSSAFIRKYILTSCETKQKCKKKQQKKNPQLSDILFSRWCRSMREMPALNF